MVNGYQLISLENKNIPANKTAQFKVEGIHDKLENSTRKMLILCDVVIDGIEQPVQVVNAYINGSNFIITAETRTSGDTFKVTVGADNIVHISAS